MKRIIGEIAYGVLTLLAGVLGFSIECLLCVYNVVDRQIYEIQRARIQD